MATTIFGVSNQVTLAHGAAVEITASWAAWDDRTFNDWMPCAAWSDDGQDGLFPEYHLTVLSSAAKQPFAGPIQISKILRNDDPGGQLNTSFSAAAVKISV